MSLKIVSKATDKPYEELLSYHLHAYAHGTRPGRSLKRIHASDVTQEDWCARRHALQLATGTGPPDESLFTAQALAFEGSSAMARIILRWATGAGVAVGDWRCLRCAGTTTYSLKPDECLKCGAGRFWYLEHRFRSEISGISGGIDLIFRVPSLKLDRIVEIKALTKDAFKGVKMPIADHRLRTNLYLRLADESNDPYAKKIDTQTATVFYMTKGGYGDKTGCAKEWGLEQDAGWAPFKEYTISRDDHQTDSMSYAAEGLWSWIKDDTSPMPPGICPSAFSTIAQRCPMRKPCFSGKW